MEFEVKRIKVKNIVVMGKGSWGGIKEGDRKWKRKDLKERFYRKMDENNLERGRGNKRKWDNEEKRE